MITFDLLKRSNQQLMKPANVIPVHRLSEWENGRIFLRHFIKENNIAERATHAHRDDHYIFFVLQSGTACFSVDFETYTVGGSSVFCVLPAQVHHIISIENATGWFLAIDTSMVDPKYRSVFEEYLLRCEPLRLSTEREKMLYRSLSTLEQHMKDEEARKAFPEIAMNLSSAVIGIMTASYWQSEQMVKTAGNRLAEINRQFRSLLTQWYTTVKSPAQYASMMNLSLTYLNEAVKATTGFPVSYWIQHVCLLEARRMLCYTDMPVKEIAFSLGYEDHAYFSRLFSRSENMPPGTFRSKYRG